MYTRVVKAHYVFMDAFSGMKEEREIRSNEDFLLAIQLVQSIPTPCLFACVDQ